jgi:hypothetical protein
VSRRAWTAFAVVQLVGAVCVWEGPRILTTPGPVLFLSGLVLLAPCGLLSLVIVERLLRSGGLTLPGMTWAELVLTLAINAALWWSVAKGWKAIRSRRPVPEPNPDRVTDSPPWHFAGP